MGKICSNCGKELSDNAKFCSKCGSKCEEVVQEKKVKRMCQKCGHEQDEKMKFCPKCGTGIKTVESRDKSKIEQVTEMASSGVMQAGSALTEGVEKSREKFNEIQNMSKEERKERAKQCVNTAKEKGAEFAGDVKDFKNLPKRKRKKVIVTLCGIVIALFIITRFIGNEPKEEYVVNAARNVVNEQLIAPGTAIYSGEEILEKDDYGRYLVYLDVDAENSYGAKVRSEWCVVVFSVTKDDFHYNNQASYVNSYSGTDVKSELAISTLKEFNDWDKPLED